MTRYPGSIKEEQRTVSTGEVFTSLCQKKTWERRGSWSQGLHDKSWNHLSMDKISLYQLSQEGTGQ